MRKTFLPVLLLSSTLAFGQAFPPDTDKDVAVGFGTGLLTNVCIAADQTLTTTGTIEEVLVTCTIPGTTFPSDFAGMEIIATYIGAANANSKTMNVRVDGIAGTIVLEVTGDTDNADTYELSGYMTVGSGGSGNLSGTGTTTQGTGASTTERMRVTGLTFASDIDVVFTGLTASSAGDVTLTSYMVRLMTGVEGDSGGHYDGGVVTNPFLGDAADSCSVPVTYGFSGDDDTGICSNAADSVRIWAGGDDIGRFSQEFAWLDVSDTPGNSSQIALRSNASPNVSVGLTAFTPGVAKFVGLTLLAENATDSNQIALSAGPVANQARFEMNGGVANKTIEFWNGAGGTKFFDMDIENTQIVSAYEIRGPNGAGSAPSFSFSTDNDAGMYLSSGLRLQFRDASSLSSGEVILSSTAAHFRFQDSAASAWGMKADDTGVEITLEDAVDSAFRETVTEIGQRMEMGASGTETLPAYSFNADTDTGMFRATNQLSLVVGGVAGHTFDLNPTNATFEHQILAPDGSTTAPAYGFTSDPDLGCFTVGGTFTCQSANTSTNPKGVLELNDTAETKLVYHDAGGLRTGVEFGDNTFDMIVENGTLAFGSSSVFRIEKSFELNQDQTPATFTSDQNNFSPSGWTSDVTLRLSTDATRSLTGLALGRDGRIGFIMNVGAFDLILTDEDALSTAANRFALGGADLTIGPEQAVGLLYDSVASRWRYLAAPLPPFDGGTVSNPVIGPNGTAALPAFAFVSDPDTGIFRNAGGNILGLSAAGAEKLQVQSGRMVGLVAYTTLDGSEGVPGFGFSNDTNTGIFSPIDETTAITGSGKEIAYFDYESASATHFELRDDADIVIEGATDDSFETTITVVDPTKANVVTIQDTLGIVPVLQTAVSTLTETTPTGLARFAIATSEFVSGEMITKVYCDDTTDEVAAICDTPFICYNDAGTESCEFINSDCAANGVEVGTGATTLSAITFASAVGTDTVDITVDATCSLTQTTLEAVWEITFKSGDGRVVTELN